MRLFNRVWGEHLLALGLFGLLSLGLTWPLVRDPSWLLIGTGLGDSYHSTWLLWHYKEAILGRQPFLYTYHLYYPQGISTLLDGVGPVGPIFSLPFAAWGPVAAYNGGILVSVWLSGYCMYLLARTMTLTPSVAYLAGIIVQAAPAHLAGVNEHYEKTFVGFLPLTLLAAYKAFEPKRSRWWAAGVGLTLGLTALYSGYQLVYAGLGVGLLFVMQWFAQPIAERWALLRRGLWVGGWGLVLVGPILALILAVANDPRVKDDVKVDGTSKWYAADVTQFVLPSFYHALLGPLVYWPTSPPQTYPDTPLPWLKKTPEWTGAGMETAVTLPLTGLALAWVALRGANRRARAWGVFTLVFIILALGPTLRVFGQTTFTDLNLPIILPYAFLISLPGIDFMRVSSRMMMMGAVGFALVAGWGLAWLQQRFPRQQYWVTGLVIGLLLLESWPRPWPQTPLPPASPFYQQLRADTEAYSVLDLPLGLTDRTVPSIWPSYTSRYQMYQILHGKPIAWGYLSHIYARHPVPVIERLVEHAVLKTPPFFIDGRPASPFSNVQADLVAAGYRYVIVHKTLSGQAGRAPEDRQAEALVQVIFGPTAPPVWEDQLIQVYQLPTPGQQPPLEPALKAHNRWRYGPGEVYYTTSPTHLQIDLPRAQVGELRLMPVVAHDPTAKDGVGVRGILDVTLDGGVITSVAIEGGKEVVIPLQLRAGTQIVAMSLRAGNFRTSDFGGQDTDLLSYGLARLELRLVP